MVTATTKPKSILALTVHQPWASLIALGLKRYETRHWPTDHRGMLAIHAGKTKVRVQLTDLVPYDQWSILPDVVPYGAVLCVVTLVDCIPTDRLLKIQGFTDSDEYRYGNFEPGRYAWQLDLVRVFQTPYPAKGEQGLWRWELPRVTDPPPAPEQRPLMPPAKQRKPRQQRMMEAAEQVNAGDLLSWQEAARQRMYDKTCALCGQPARMLIVRAGWCCDECAWKLTVESSENIRREVQTYGD